MQCAFSLVALLLNYRCLLTLALTNETFTQSKRNDKQKCNQSHAKHISPPHIGSASDGSA